MSRLTERLKQDPRLGISFILFLLYWSLYAWTAAPGVTMHDSGELITSAHVLGIGHPPGAPTWVLLAKLFTFIPVGSIAYRVHLMSGFFAAATCCLVYLFSLMLISQRGLAPRPAHHLVAVLASALLAQSPALWMKATQAELCSLNVFFMMLILMLLVKWNRQPAEAPGQGARLLLIAALFGLGMGNFMALSCYIPIVLITVLRHDRGILKKGRLLCGLAASGLAGLLIYLYLPIRSRVNPAIDWGNPETFHHFRIVFSPKRWGELTWSDHSSEFIQRWLDSISLHGELGLPALVLIVLGLAALFKKERSTAWMMTGFFFVYGIWMMMLQALSLDLNRDLYYIKWYGITEFHIPLYTVAAPLIAVGAADTLDYLRPRLESFKLTGLPAWLCGSLASIVLIALPGIPHYKACNLRHYTQPGILAEEILETCSTNSWLFSPGDDPQFAIAYTKFVEGVREDVALMTPRTSFFREVSATVKPGHHAAREDLLNTTKGRIEELMEVRYNQTIPLEASEVRMFFTKPPAIPSLQPTLFPQGLLFELMPEALYNGHTQRQFWNAFLARPEFQPGDQMPHDFKETMASMLQHHGDWHYTRQEYDLAAFLYERCLAYSEPVRKDVLDRLAYALLDLNQLDGAYSLCRQAIVLNARNRTAWSTLARVLIKQGRLADAAASYESILAFAPDDEDARDNLTFLKKKLGAQP
jgi:hypothetical protein